MPRSSSPSPVSIKKAFLLSALAIFWRPRPHQRVQGEKRHLLDLSSDSISHSVSLPALTVTILHRCSSLVPLRWFPSLRATSVRFATTRRTFFDNSRVPVRPPPPLSCSPAGARGPDLRRGLRQKESDIFVDEIRIADVVVAFLYLSVRTGFDP
jgi:hypothetical protein